MKKSITKKLYCLIVLLKIFNELNKKMINKKK